MNTPHRPNYALPFLAMMLVTGSMVYYDYNAIGGLPEIPLQASILGMPISSNQENGTTELSDNNSPLLREMSGNETDGQRGPEGITSSFKFSTPPKTPTPSITTALFTSNPVSISQPLETNSFLRFVSKTDQVLPIIKYTIELTNSWDPEAKFINVYEIEADSEREAKKQEQILLQLSALQSNNRYTISPTSGEEFLLIPAPDQPNLRFHAIQIGKNVYGFEYHKKMYNQIMIHVVNKLKDQAS
jgi:hypothetical protein